MNKKILIFGGTGAIGFSIAKNLKEQGYNPIIIARNKEDLISKSKEINCSYEICDVLEIDQIKEIALKHSENVIGLAYCVGSINLRPLKITKDQDFIESFKVNTLGAINAVKINLQNSNFKKLDKLHLLISIPGLKIILSKFNSGIFF